MTSLCTWCGRVSPALILADPCGDHVGFRHCCCCCCYSFERPPGEFALSPTVPLARWERDYFKKLQQSATRSAFLERFFVTFFYSDRLFNIYRIQSESFQYKKASQSSRSPASRCRTFSVCADWLPEAAARHPSRLPTGLRRGTFRCSKPDPALMKLSAAYEWQCFHVDITVHSLVLHKF